MSTCYKSDYARQTQRRILWDETRTAAAKLLAEGYSQTYTAEQVGVHRNTIGNWIDDPEFYDEVNRLTFMTGFASRTNRLRLINRVVRQRMREDGFIETDKDLLDWLKFAQSETDGAKIDLSKLAEMLTGEADGPSQPLLSSPTIDVEATNMDHGLGLPDVATTDDDNHNPSLDHPPITTNDD